MAITDNVPVYLLLMIYDGGDEIEINGFTTKHEASDALRTQFESMLVSDTKYSMEEAQSEHDILWTHASITNENLPNSSIYYFIVDTTLDHVIPDDYAKGLML